MLLALALTTDSALLRAEEAAGAPPILIGLLLPPEEAEAASLRRGVQLGVDHANRLPGAKVSLLVRGRVGQWGADGEEAGRMVLDDGARGLIAPPGGAPSHLALQVAGRTATPVISLCPDSSVVGAGIPWMVRIVPGTRDEARMLFAAFRTNAAGHPFRWSALVPNERAGREAASDLRYAAEAAGCSLDRPVEVSPKLKDFSEIGKPVLATQPDGIVLWLDAPLAGGLVKSLRAAGFNGQLAGPGRLESAGFTTQAGKAAEGFVLPSPVRDAASQSVAARFAAEYRQQFGNEPDTTTRMAYDAAVLLTDLLRKSGDNPSRRAFPITGEQPGASGSLKFDRNGNRLVPLELLQFRDGRFIPFAGENAAAFHP
jgi:ABC-type branched-subunit amino acid transport system substrate-binding protein